LSELRHPGRTQNRHQRIVFNRIGALALFYFAGACLLALAPVFKIQGVSGMRGAEYDTEKQPQGGRVRRLIVVRLKVSPPDQPGIFDHFQPALRIVAMSAFFF
jgi:hypothetical protein